MEFTTEVADVDIYGLGTDADETSFSDMTVKWNCDIEAREWGIRMISIYPVSVKGSITLSENYYEDEKETVEKEIEFDSMKDWDLQWEGTENIKISNEIMPDNVSIDFKYKIITVNF